MRVLHVYSGNLYGGVEAFLVSLSRRSRDGGHRHEFALCFEGRLATELRGQKASVHTLGPARFSQPWTVVRSRSRLANLLHENCFDLVICHSPWSAAVFGKLVLRLNIPLILYLHGHVDGKHWTDRLAARCNPLLVIAVSASVADKGRLVFRKSAFEILHNPLPQSIEAFDGSQRDSVRAALGVNRNEVVVIQVSRLEPLKGHLQSVAALGKLDQLKHWRNWIVGGPQRREELLYLQQIQRMVREAGIVHRVQFLGERNDVPQLMAAADIFLQANSGPEGLGIVFMEAMAAGLPVVTSRLGGASELIDASCGILLEAGDVDAVAAALEKLIVDPGLRQRLGEAGRQRILKRSSPATHFEHLSKLLARYCLNRGSECPKRLDMN